MNCPLKMFPFDDHQFNLFADPQISNPQPTLEIAHQEIVSNFENEERRIIRRDVERDRRKQMTSLLTHLQSLLPLQFIQERRTRADIVDEAVNYIEHMKGKINELHDKRDELKRLNNLDYSSSSQNQSSNLCLSSNCVVMNPYSGGLEIVIRSWFRAEENLQISRVMRFLFEQNIEVQSFASTKLNERILHTIHTKVDNSRRIDVYELQQKLYQVICNS